MSSFIVIGTNDKVKKIVDHIEKYGQQSHCNISTGVISYKDEAIHYNWISQFNNEKNNNDSKATSSLSNLLTNQISHLKSSVQNKKDPINIFLICSLNNNEDYKHIKLVLDGINDIKDKNISLTSILLSFNIEKPHDVVDRADAKTISQTFDLFKNFAKVDETGLKSFPCHVMYLNNTDFDNAYIDYNINNEFANLLAEMLTSFCALKSNANDQYGIGNAIGGEFFTLGYCDYNYRNTDITNYVLLNFQKDIIDDILHKGDNYDFSFDTCCSSETLKYIEEICKFRLHSVSKTKSLLDRIFAEPNFEDANDLKAIFSTDNEGYLFKQQDLTIQKIVAYLDEINKSADRQTDLSDAEEESTIVSYPNFINWDELKSLTKGNIDRLTTKQYNSIIEKVKEYDEYRKYFYSDHFKTKLDELIYKYESIEKPEEIIITTIPEKKKVSWWRRIFNFIFGIKPKEDPIKEYANQPSGEDLTNSNTASDIDECWYFLKRMQELRNNYTQYINKYEELALKQSSIQDSIDKFELFNHNRSRCAIDDSKIYNYYKNQFENLKDKLENHDEEQDILDVFKDAYKVVNQRKDIWGKFDLNDPHDFIVIKEDNLHDIIKEIHAKSTPFTNILIDESSDYSDKIHRMIYSDNDLTDWFEKNKSQVNYSHFITVKRSSSVVNKICMFQFFTLDNYLQCLGDLRE